MTRRVLIGLLLLDLLIVAIAVMRGRSIGFGVVAAIALGLAIWLGDE